MLLRDVCHQQIYDTFPADSFCLFYQNLNDWGRMFEVKFQCLKIVNQKRTFMSLKLALRQMLFFVAFRHEIYIHRQPKSAADLSTMIG